jgi:hypothetical protein
MPKDSKRGAAMSRVKRRVANLTRGRIERRRAEVETAAANAARHAAAAPDELHRRELIGVDIMFASIVLRLRMLRYYALPTISPPARESAMFEDPKDKAAAALASRRRSSLLIAPRGGAVVRPFLRQRRVTPVRASWCP